jgi:hypothetical protein
MAVRKADMVFERLMGQLIGQADMAIRTLTWQLAGQVDMARASQGVTRGPIKG